MNSLSALPSHHSFSVYIRGQRRYFFNHWNGTGLVLKQSTTNLTIQELTKIFPGEAVLAGYALS